MVLKKENGEEINLNFTEMEMVHKAFLRENIKAYIDYEELKNLSDKANMYTPKLEDELIDVIVEDMDQNAFEVVMEDIVSYQIAQFDKNLPEEDKSLEEVIDNIVLDPYALIDEAAGELGWEVFYGMEYDSVQNEEIISSATFKQNTPLGEEFSFDVSFYNPADLVGQVRMFAESYDIDKQINVFADKLGDGIYETIEDLIADANGVKEMLTALTNELEKFHLSNKKDEIETDER